jgi:DNA-binding NtrC family response regulator
MANSSKWKILYAEGDADVLASQAALLQKAGHEVTTAVGRKGVEDFLKHEAYELVVLGPTLSRNDRHHLPYMVKKANEKTRVLVLHTDGSRHPYVDGNTDTGQSIEHLIEMISSMMGTQKATAKSMAAGVGR